MFIKQKRDGKVKRKTVAGETKQINYIKKDSNSPTVSTEPVLLGFIIDAMEKGMLHSSIFQMISFIY